MNKKKQGAVCTAETTDGRCGGYATAVFRIVHIDGPVVEQRRRRQRRRLTDRGWRLENAKDGGRWTVAVPDLLLLLLQPLLRWVLEQQADTAR